MSKQKRRKPGGSSGSDSMEKREGQGKLTVDKVFN